MSRAALFIIFLVLQLLHSGSSRSVRDSNLLVSDGLDDKLISQSYSLLQVVDDLKADTVTCEPIYGFLPCATSFWGVLFMVIVYEILLYLANDYISRGSNLFFTMYGTGFFGASVFHILGTIPQVGIVLGNFFASSKFRHYVYMYLYILFIISQYYLLMIDVRYLDVSHQHQL